MCIQYAHSAVLRRLLPVRPISLSLSLSLSVVLLFSDNIIPASGRSEQQHRAPFNDARVKSDFYLMTRDNR
jgi:hypothetical protein